jgi:Double zinc ribbon
LGAGKDNENDAIKKLEDEIKKHNDWQKEIIKIQYNKLANDWISFNNLIWAVPTVAVAIMTGMLVAAYRPEFNLLPHVRIVILSLGSLFLFALTIEVVKKRFHMNVISLLLKDLQAELGLKEEFRFPLGISGDIDEYLKKRLVKEKKLADYEDPVFNFFKISYARKYLTYVILIAALSLALLAEWEFISLEKDGIWFHLVGFVVGIGAATATISYYIYKKFSNTKFVCKQCGKTNHDGSKFCNNCGSKLQDPCTKCGNINPVGSAFCGKCGNAL